MNFRSLKTSLQKIMFTLLYDDSRPYEPRLYESREQFWERFGSVLSHLAAYTSRVGYLQTQYGFELSQYKILNENYGRLSAAMIEITNDLKDRTEMSQEAHDFLIIRIKSLVYYCDALEESLRDIRKMDTEVRSLAGGKPLLRVIK